MPVWVVRAMREHYGAGEKWVYLVTAKDRTTAIEVAKEECGYNEMEYSPGGLPTGIWSFSAYEQSHEVVVEITHSSWGGW